MRNASRRAAGPAASHGFALGDRVRYRPGLGTYGYEDVLAGTPDHRMAAVVVGFTTWRVRIRIVTPGRCEHTIKAVDAESLIHEPSPSPEAVAR